MDHIENQIRSQDKNALSEEGAVSSGNKRELIFHRTHATDPHQFRKVLNTVLTSIQAANLAAAGLV